MEWDEMTCIFVLSDYNIIPSKSKDPTKDVLCRSGPKKYIRRETIEMSRFHVPRNHGNFVIPCAHVCSRLLTFAHGLLTLHDVLFMSLRFLLGS